MGSLLMLVLVAAIASLQGQSANRTREDQMLHRIRQVMVQNLDSMPNYACRQTIDRQGKFGKAARFVKIDKFRMEVAFLEGNELYSTANSESFGEKDFQSLAANGAFGTGVFALYSTHLFRGNAATFTFAGDSRFHGRHVVRYDYNVPLAHSRFEVQVGGGRAILPYEGHFLADPVTGDLVMLEVHARDIPPELSLSSLSHVFEYKRVRIGDAKPLLPVKSEIRTLGVIRNTFKLPSAAQFKTVTEIDSCRRFTAESQIFTVESEIFTKDRNPKK